MYEKLAHCVSVTPVFRCVIEKSLQRVSMIIMKLFVWMQPFRA